MRQSALRNFLVVIGVLAASATATAAPAASASRVNSYIYAEADAQIARGAVATLFAMVTTGEGAASEPANGLRLTLQRRIGKTWTNHVSQVSHAENVAGEVTNGAVRVRLRPATTTAYRWVFAGTGAYLPSASRPFTVRVVTPRFRSNPACARRQCRLLAIRNEIGPLKLQLELIGLPLARGASEAGRQQHVALYDRAGRLVYMSPRFGGAFSAASGRPAADPAFEGVIVDRAGRVFLPYIWGSNVFYVVVVDTGARPFQTYRSLPEAMRFSASEAAGAVDVTGDGINEIVLVQDDSTRGAVEGTDYAFFYGWRARNWRLIGCSKLTPGTRVAGPPTLAPGSPGCPLSGHF